MNSVESVPTNEPIQSSILARSLIGRWTETTMRTRVKIVPLGPVCEQLDIPKIARNLNDIQEVYIFSVDDPLTNLPAPTIQREGVNESPQYDPTLLFEYIYNYRGGNDDSDIMVGLIDSEVYDELYSTVDLNNQMILVSIRVPELPGVIKISRKTYGQYVELEIGAQLLAIQYRTRADLQALPTECEKPWHITRRNCLFDYHGLSEQSVQKLMSPKISDQVIAEFTLVELPQRYIVASLRIVKAASTTLWSEVRKRIPYDPTLNLAFGALIGLFASIFANQEPNLWYIFISVALLAMVIRLILLKKG